MLTIKIAKLGPDKFKVFMYLGEKLVEMRVVETTKRYQVLEKVGIMLKCNSDVQKLVS